MLYYVAIIIITTALTYFIHIALVKEGIDQHMQKEREENNAWAEKTIRKKFAKGGTLDEAENEARQIGEMRRNHIVVANLEGELLHRGFFFDNKNSFKIPPNLLPLIKEGKTVQGHLIKDSNNNKEKEDNRDNQNNKEDENPPEVKNPRKKREPGSFIASPLYIKNKVAGIIVNMTPPKPPSDVPKIVKMAFIQAMIIALIFSCITAFFFARSITSPIHRMESSAKKIALGDFSCRMNLKRRDELGILAGAFDDMASKLDRHIKSRNRMMMDISHELSTPLTAIQGMVEALQDDIIPYSEKNFYLESILKQINLLSVLIDDVSELSRFENKEIRLNKIPFNPAEMIESAVESAQLNAMKKDIRIISSVEEEIPVLGDPRRIRQVMDNLINNAIVHNPPGTEIQVLLKKEGEKVLIAVEDNGKEIPPDEMEHIFERFYKVDQSRSGHASGAGLGLAIVREILQAHNTHIMIKTIDKNKMFFFYLSTGNAP